MLLRVESVATASSKSIQTQEIPSNSSTLESKEDSIIFENTIDKTSHLKISDNP